jgi:hypothetical protein
VETTVTYSLGGTAQGGVDYVTPSALTAVFLLGSSSEVITISVLSVAVLDGPHSVQLALTGSSDPGVVIGDASTGTFDILDAILATIDVATPGSQQGMLCCLLSMSRRSHGCAVCFPCLAVHMAS